MAEARRIQGNQYRDWQEVAAWAKRRTEPALEPDLPIVDPHHHLWHNPRSRYLMPDLLDDLDCGHNIVATVFIEAKAMYRAGGDPAFRPVGEVEFVNGVAAMSASGHFGGARLCAGIVGHADLALGDAVQPVLDALATAGGGRFRGIRHYVRWDTDRMVATGDGTPPPDYMADERFRRGLARLAAGGYTFEAWAFHPILPRVAALAAAVPQATLILNHVGGPLGLPPYDKQGAENFAAWRENMKALAVHPNIVVKLGGLGMLYCGFDFHKADTPPDSETLAAVWKPYIETAIELFGVERCMFESNFPVDKQSSNYGVLWNAFKRLTRGASVAEKAALYHDTAVRHYRLPV